MFCSNCGKEMSEDTYFCPSCGAKVGEDGVSRLKENSVQQTLGPINKEINSPKKKKIKFWIPIILIVGVIVGCIAYPKIEEKALIKETDMILTLVQSGVDNDTADEIIKTAIPQLIQNENVAEFIVNNVSGEDAMDIYHSLMRYMIYQIDGIQKVEKNHYQVQVTIANLDNRIVLSNAVEIFTSRYNNGLVGNLFQLYKDATSDKSKLVADVITESADQCYKEQKNDLWLEGTYIIDFYKENGKWTPSTDVESVALKCLGMK